jgi:hypothetical protein
MLCAMGTEVWFRNPDNYVRELVECAQGNICFDRGYLIKRNIDVQKWAALYFGAGLTYRLLTVGSQGTAEYRPGSDEPVAVYPTWAYGEEWAMLEEIVSEPLGENKEVCFDTSIPKDERPVFGQEHRVVVIEPPNSSSGPGRQFLRNLKILQEDYPSCIIHIHGLYGYRAAFGLGLGAADVEPRTAAQKGKVHLPSGGEAKFEKVQNHAQWVTAMGFTPGDLSVPRNRCMYNIKAAVWAGKHYTELINVKVRGGNATPDTVSSELAHRPETTMRPFTLPIIKAQEGDKFACDSCSLSGTCKHYREGAVCSLPESESRELATHFQTRDSGLIMDGLAEITRLQARRTERAIQIEEIDGDVDDKVTKMLNVLFDQGSKLAKLIDPSLRAPGVQVNVGAGGQASVQVTPQQAIAAIYRELEMRGVPRNEITPDMVKQLLGQMTPQSNRVIPGEIERGEQSA